MNQSSNNTPQFPFNVCIFSYGYKWQSFVNGIELNVGTTNKTKQKLNQPSVTRSASRCDARSVITPFEK
ncbi:hypothetical protein BLOT_016719 [Blomia tropicalis]|nr:hypothetical protein BLOT_016719 [Blomia tropicalis]